MPIPNITPFPVRATANDSDTYIDGIALSLSELNTAIDEMNVSNADVNTKASEVASNATAAAQSETNAAQSETNAAQSETNAAQSEANAQLYKNDAQVAAAAAGAAAGLPALAGNAYRILTVRGDESGFDWSVLGITGDIVLTTNPVAYTAPEWLECNGELYDTAVYSELYSFLGDQPTRLTDTTSPPSSNAYAGRISPNGLYIALGLSASPFGYVYKRTGDTFNTRIDLSGGNPNPASSGCRSVSWGGNDYVAFSNRTTAPYVKVYKRTGDAFNKLTDPPSPASPVYAYVCQFSHGATYLAWAGDGGDGIAIVKRTGDSFALLSNVDARVGSSPSEQGMAWSPDDNYLAVGCFGGGKYLELYKRTGDDFSLITNTAFDVEPSGIVFAVRWSPDGQYLAIGMYSSSDTPVIRVYKQSGDNFTLLTNNFDEYPENGVSALAWNDESTQICVCQQNGTNDETFYYNRVDDNFYRIPNPAGTPDYMFDADYNGDYIVQAGVGSPSMYNFKNTSTLPDIDVGTDWRVKAYIKTGEVAA